MEIDLSNARRIILAETNALSMTDGSRVVSLAGLPLSFGYVEGIGTDAIFNALTGFAQLNDSHIVAVDQINNCLRLIARSDWSTSSWVGKCLTPGYQDGLTRKTSLGSIDGSFQEALFHCPRSVQFLSEQVYVDADSLNSKLRILNTETQCVYSICTGDTSLLLGDADNCAIVFPSALLLIDGELYIGMMGYIVKISGWY